MNFSKLNPFVRSMAIYETVSRTEECRAYDARLLYMISGDISVSIDGGKKFHLSTGSLLFIPAGARYRLSGQYLMCAVLDFDLDDSYSDIFERIMPSPTADFDEARCHSCGISPFDRHLLCEDMDSLRDEFIKMEKIAASAEGEWRAELSARLKLILLRLAEGVSENALPTQMVEALDAYIRENASDEISNTEIGAIFGYHPFYVSRLIKEKKGLTLRQYIIAYRLKVAKKLLEVTARPIADIAEQTGFTDASYFTKTFRAAFGVTPKEWRNKFKEEFI